MNPDEHADALPGTDPGQLIQESAARPTTGSPSEEQAVQSTHGP